MNKQPDIEEKCSLLLDHINKIQQVLDDSKAAYESDVASFLKTNIFQMGKFIRLYSELMSRLKTKLNQDTIDELELIDQETNNQFHLVQSLSKLKYEWDAFLELVEQNVNIFLKQYFFTYSI